MAKNQTNTQAQAGIIQPEDAAQWLKLDNAALRFRDVDMKARCDLVRKIAEAAEMTVGNPTKTEKCKPEDRAERQALQTELCALSVESGLHSNMASARPAISRIMREVGLAQKCERVKTARPANGNDNATETGTDWQACNEAKRAMRNVIADTSENPPPTFWADLSRLCALYGEGKINSADLQPAVKPSVKAIAEKHARQISSIKPEVKPSEDAKAEARALRAKIRRAVDSVAGK